MIKSVKSIHRAAVALVICLSQCCGVAFAIGENAPASSAVSAAISPSAPNMDKQKGAVITEKPTTLNVEVSGEELAEVNRAVSGEGASLPLRLKINGLIPPRSTSKVYGFKMFFNKPNATAETSEKDPHFVGAVAFQPTADQKPQSFYLDLNRTLNELHRGKQLDLKQPLNVTIVPLSKDSEQPAEKVRIPVESVQVRVSKVSP
jgi:hypothetical protein